MKESEIFAARRQANAEHGERLFDDPQTQKKFRYEKQGDIVFDKANKRHLAYHFHSAVGSALFYYGGFETGEIALCARMLRLDKNAVMLDVGANIGTHCIGWALSMPDASLFAFEPAPDNLELLERNLAANGLTNRVTVVPKAVSSHGGVATFFETDDAAYSALRYTGRRPLLSEYEVELVTIDDFVRERGLDRVSLIKIDVEGSEDDVLAGARETLEKFHPLIFIEIYGGDSSNPDPEHTIASLRALGYNPHLISDGIATPFKQHDDTFYNYLFVHDSDKRKLPAPDLELKRRIDAERLQLIEKLTDDLRESSTELLSARRGWEELDRATLEKDGEIAELTQSAQGLREQLARANDAIRELTLSAAQLQQQLEIKDAAIQNLTKTTVGLNAQLDEKDGALKEKDRAIDELSASADALSEQLEQKQASMTQLVADMQEKDALIVRLNEELRQASQEVGRLRYDEVQQWMTPAARSLQDQLRNITAAAEDKDALIESLSHSAQTLQAQLIEKDALIESLSSSAEGLRRQLTASHAALGEKDALIESLSESASALQKQLVTANEAVMVNHEALKLREQQLAELHAAIAQRQELLERTSAEAEMLRMVAEERLATLEELSDVANQRLEVIRSLNEDRRLQTQ
jgi:FkbM family methyltransferase